MSFLVACVKWGDKYSADHVNILKNMVERNLTLEHEFRCFTDDPTGLECESEVLPGGSIGWWNKLHLFSLDRPILYFDLDLVICRNIDHLATDYFSMAKDAWIEGGNSSVMSIRPGMEHVSKNPDLSLPGDQDWINRKTKPAYYADVISYKDKVKEVPSDASVVFFHGKPKPWDVLDDFVLEHYW